MIKSDWEKIEDSNPKNEKIALFLLDVPSYCGGFLYKFCSAYIHADGENRRLLDSAMVSMRLKYNLDFKYEAHYKKEL
jgi:hypothetical protein